MSLITERQLEYIHILSSCDYSKKEDEADIANYLKQHGKQTLSELSKREASELIQLLLKRPAQYVFPCGETAILDKQEINGYNVLGFMEGCMHACPNKKIQGNIHGCPDFLKFYESEIEQEYNKEGK